VKNIYVGHEVNIESGLEKKLYGREVSGKKQMRRFATDHSVPYTFK
jgi:hypothetical protein